MSAQNWISLRLSQAPDKKKRWLLISPMVAVVVGKPLSDVHVLVPYRYSQASQIFQYSWLLSLFSTIGIATPQASQSKDISTISYLRSLSMEHPQYQQAIGIQGRPIHETVAELTC